MIKLEKTPLEEEQKVSIPSDAEILALIKKGKFEILTRIKDVIENRGLYESILEVGMLPSKKICNALASAREALMIIEDDEDNIKTANFAKEMMKEFIEDQKYEAANILKHYVENKKIPDKMLSEIRKIRNNDRETYSKLSNIIPSFVLKEIDISK